MQWTGEVVFFCIFTICRGGNMHVNRGKQKTSNEVVWYNMRETKISLWFVTDNGDVED